MSHWCRRLILPILVVGAVCCLGCGPRAGKWPYVVELGESSVNVEVALTPEQCRRGLMFRSELGKDWGMLFVYGAEDKLSFWMKNTKVPLSIAFIDRNLVVRDVQDMTPMSEELHTSKAPVMYALEVNRGWFSRHGIEPGTTVNFSPELEALIKDGG